MPCGTTVQRTQQSNRGRLIMSNGYDGQLMREAKELARKYDVDLNVALQAVIGAKQSIAMYKIKDVLKDIYDYQTREF